MQSEKVLAFPMLPDGLGPWGGAGGTMQYVASLAARGLGSMPVGTLTPARKALADAQEQGRALCGVPRVHGAGSPQCEGGAARSAKP